MEVEIDPAATDPDRLARLLKATAKAEGKHPSRVTLEFVSPAAMTELNRKYRERTGPTDVLSFPFDGSFPQGSGGQIVICREEAALGAAQHGREVELEIDRLAVHGMLHLLGHTDGTDSDLAEMERRTDAILEDVRG